MANIEKRGESYRIRVSAGYDVNGKQLIRRMTWTPPAGTTEKKAEKMARHEAELFEERVLSGQVTEGSKIKFQAFCQEHWFPDYVETQLRPRTVDCYLKLMKRIYPFFGHMYMDRIYPAHLMQFYRELSQTTKITTYKCRLDLRAYLKGLGYSCTRFANESGISCAALANICKGKNVSETNAKKVADFLKIPVEALFEAKHNSETLSNNTISKYHRVLSSVFQTAVQWQIIVANPCQRVSPPKVERQEQIFLDAPQAIHLLELLQDQPIQYRAAATVLLFTGMRRGEVLGLEWQDYDFDKHLLNISRTTQYLPSKGIFDDDTKTYSSMRVLKVPQTVANILEEQKEWQMKQKALAGSFWKGSQKIFTMPDGAPIHPDTLSGWFHDFIAEHPELPQIHLHSLRHTNATLAISNGTAVTTVAGQLGHASPDTTTRIYAHSIRTAQAAAADLMEDILNPKDNKQNTI